MLAQSNKDWAVLSRMKSEICEIVVLIIYEIENLTMVHKMLKYRIVIHAKSQSSSRNFYKSEIEKFDYVPENLKVWNCNSG